MRLIVEVRGNAAAFLAGERTRLATEITEAVNFAGASLRDELRGQVRVRFKRGPRRKGRNLEKAVRARTYPEGRRGRSLGPASLVWIPWEPIEIHERGGTIRGKPYLAIPTPEAVKLGLAENQERRGDLGRFRRGSQAKRAQVEAAARRFGGSVRTIPAGRGMLLLGIDPETGRGAGLRVTKTFRNRAGRRRARDFVPLFVLVRQTRLRPRIDIDGPAARWSARLHADIAEIAGA